jgi:hypothetical protein
MNPTKCFAIKQVGIRMKASFSVCVAEVVCIVDQTEVRRVLCSVS